MIYVVSKYVISFAGAQTSLLAKYPKRQGARKTNAFTDYSKQCCAAIQATCRRQQTPQLWREWWWKGTDYFFLLNMPHLMTVSLNVLSDVRLCCKSKRHWMHSHLVILDNSLIRESGQTIIVKKTKLIHCKYFMCDCTSNRNRAQQNNISKSKRIKIRTSLHVLLIFD